MKEGVVSAIDSREAYVVGAGHGDSYVITDGPFYSQQSYGVTPRSIFQNKLGCQCDGAPSEPTLEKQKTRNYSAPLG